MPCIFTHKNCRPSRWNGDKKTASDRDALQTKLKGMYLWRRLATRKWKSRHEEELRAMAGNNLAIVERSDRKLLQFEVASNQRPDLQSLARTFGGRIEKLPRDWLKRSLNRRTKPIRIRNRRLHIPAGAAFGTGEHATTAMSLRLLEKLTRNWDSGWS